MFNAVVVLEKKTLGGGLRLVLVGVEVVGDGWWVVGRIVGGGASRLLSVSIRLILPIFSNFTT